MARKIVAENSLSNSPSKILLESSETSEGSRTEEFPSETRL